MTRANIVGFNFYRDEDKIDAYKGKIRRDTENGGGHVTVMIYEDRCLLEGPYNLKDWIKANFRGVRWDSSGKHWEISRVEFDKIINDNKDFFMAYVRGNHGDRNARLGDVPKSVKGSRDPQWVDPE